MIDFKLEGYYDSGSLEAGTVRIRCSKCGFYTSVAFIDDLERGIVIERAKASHRAAGCSLEPEVNITGLV